MIRESFVYQKKLLMQARACIVFALLQSFFQSARGQIMDLFSPSMPNPDITIALARRTRCAAKFQLCLHEQLRLGAAAHPVPQFFCLNLALQIVGPWIRSPR